MADERGIEDLYVRIRADFADLQKDFRTLKTKVTKGSKESVSGARQMGAAFDSVGRRLRNLALVAGTAFAAMLSFRKIIQSLNSIDGLAKTADRIGTTAEALQTMRHAAGIAGASMGDMDNALRFMLRNISDAVDGVGEAKDQFEKLGISVEELKRMAPDQAFGVIADAMNDMETQADKTAAAMDIFGRSGAKMLNLIAGGSEAIVKARKDIESVGGLISREEAARVEMANDNMRRLGLAFGAITDQITIGLSPALSFLSKQLTQVKGDGEEVQDTFGSAGDVMVRASAYASDGVHGLKLAFAGAQWAVNELIAAVLQGVPGMVQAFSDATNIITTVWTRSVRVLDTSWEAARAGIVYAWKSLQKAIVYVIDGILQYTSRRLYDLANIAGVVSDDLEQKLIAASASVGRAGREMWNEAVEASKSALEQWDTASDRATAAWTTLFSSIPQSFSAGSELLTQLTELTNAAAQEAVNAETAFIKMGTAAMPSAEILPAWEATLAELDAKLLEIQDKQQALNEETGDETVLDPVAAARLESEQILEIITDRNSSLAEVEDAHNALVLAKKKEYLDKIRHEEANLAADIEAMWDSGVRGQIDAVALLADKTSSILGDLSTLMDSESRTMFNVGKAAAIGKATVDTFSAAVGAYSAMSSIPYVGPALGAAAAAAAIAAGTTNIAKISSTQFGGGGGGTPSVPGAVSAGSTDPAAFFAALRDRLAPPDPIQDTPEAPTPVQRSVEITMVGERYSDAQVRDLIAAINDAVDDGATIRVNTGAGARV